MSGRSRQGSRENLEVIMCGQRNTMQVFPGANGEIRLGLSVDGGVRVYELDNSSLVAPGP